MLVTPERTAAELSPRLWPLMAVHHRHHRAKWLCAFRLDDLHHLHHAEIFMIENVAVHHECSDVVGILRVDVDLLTRRDQDRILPYGLRLPGGTEPVHLEWIYVDVEDMRHRRNALIGDRILRGAQ